MQQKWYPAGRDNPARVEPYSVIAEFYDLLMEHVDYCAWADYILVLCHKYNHPPGRILDIACGTGSLMLEFMKRGCTPYGSDRSLSMLRAASHKLMQDTTRTHSCNLFQSDILALPLGAEFDTIVCMYDSMNYLPSVRDVISTARNIVSLLPAGGVFIFDMCTEYNSLKHFNGTSSSDTYEQYSCTRYSHYRKADKVQVTDFIITDNKTGAVRKERHSEYIYPIEEIYNTLDSSVKGEVRMFKDYTFDPPDNRSERVHFYIRKV